MVAAAVGGADIFNGVAGQEQKPSSEPESTATTCQVHDRATLIPATGALFGVNLDWNARSLEGYAYDVGHKPAVSDLSSGFPYSPDEKTDLQRDVALIRTNSQMMLLTLRPEGGLGSVTPETALTLANDLAEFNNDGVPVLVRFAPEMNGTWYPWSQQPAQYIAAFRALADAIHTHAPGSAMMWAPNYGDVYPFTGDQYEAKPGTPEFAALDTDSDGTLTMSDDPYAPYYPGDDAVDWVGMSLYHWGSEYPWGENELPEPGKFADQLRGNYTGSNGEETQIPDFYQNYGEAHGKPVAITETAALYIPGAGGEPELAIKQAWWGQLFGPATAAQFPQLKMISWYERDTVETGIKGRVDWTVTRTPELRDAFKAALPDWLRYGPPQPCTPPNHPRTP